MVGYYDERGAGTQAFYDQAEGSAAAINNNQPDYVRDFYSGQQAKARPNATNNTQSLLYGPRREPGQSRAAYDDLDIPDYTGAQVKKRQMGGYGPDVLTDRLAARRVAGPGALATGENAMQDFVGSSTNTGSRIQARGSQGPKHR